MKTSYKEYKLTPKQRKFLQEINDTANTELWSNYKTNIYQILDLGTYNNIQRDRLNLFIGERQHEKLLRQ